MSKLTANVSVVDMIDSYAILMHTVQFYRVDVPKNKITDMMHDDIVNGGLDKEEALMEATEIVLRSAGIDYTCIAIKQGEITIWK